MGFKLPRLTTDVDCEPLGYPGLVFTFWLNATNPSEEWLSPAERDPPVTEPEPWDLPWLHVVAGTFDRVTIPGAYTESGEEEVIEIPDAKAVYDLHGMPGFEQKLLNWALEVLRLERLERFQVEAKN